jgi:hypothetical protein
VCPITASPFAHETGSESQSRKASVGQGGGSIRGGQLVSYSSYPAQVPRPDDPDCRELQAEGSSSVSDAVVLMVKVSPTTHGALLVPLQDDCYGNSILTRGSVFRDAFQYRRAHRGAEPAACVTAFGAGHDRRRKLLVPMLSSKGGISSALLQRRGISVSRPSGRLP